eukprot:gnl/Spiro4/10991_TR5825_c0_g2_i1.p1 gnl/Spiro4/10991_TR5825_c0_g2~~gnl/Spiro4/10991_TR5825_c0_g2_i1.p1  ORF type:complete len:795 (-),score=-5.88 gnl/Spiro4/10991_TR5825_c0_g2_i1:245-2314(-)
MTGSIVGISGPTGAIGPMGLTGLQGLSTTMGATGIVGATGPTGPSEVFGATGSSYAGATGASTPDYWTAVDAAYKPPALKLDPSLEKDLTKELLGIDPSTSLAVEEEINYAKYQTQIKEKAEEFLRSFDKGKFAKKADDHKSAKLEELKQKVEDLKKDRETQTFAAELVAEHKKASPPPLDVFALNRCAFNVDIKDFLRWSSEDAQKVKYAFDQYVDTGMLTWRQAVEDKINLANLGIAVAQKIESEKEAMVKTELARRAEQAKIAEDIKDIKNKVNAILDQESIRSYGEASNFVGGLINIGLVESKDFISQINKCEKWNENDYKTIRQRTNSFIKGDLTSSFTEIKTLIAKANAAVTSPPQDKVKVADGKHLTLSRTPGTTIVSVKNSHGTEIEFLFTSGLSRTEKAERLNNIVTTSNGHVTAQTLLGLSTPELTADDIHYWMDYFFMGAIDPHTVKPKKQNQTSKEVEKISRMLLDNKLQIKDLDKYVALGIISSAGLKAWRIQDQATNNYFYDDFSKETEALVADLSAYEEISDEEFKQLVGLTFPTQFETEARRAGLRVASTQANKVTRAAIIKALPDDKAELMKSFLASELGNSFVGMVGGLTLTYAMPNNDTAQDLAKELRVASLATLGNEAVDVLTDGMFGIIKGAVQELPEISKEVSIENERIEEDLEFLREEKINQKMMN